MAEYPPFRVWMQTTRDITDEASTYVSTEEFTGADGEGIVLPLDPAQIDDAAIDAMCAAEDAFVVQNGIDGQRGNTIEDRMRALLAALLAHLAEDA